MWNFCQITMSNFGLIDVRIIVSEKEQSGVRTHAHRKHVRKCFLQTHRTRSSVYVRFFCNSQLEKEQPVKNYFIVVIAFAFEY